MKKIFKRNYEALETEVENKNGEMIPLKSVVVFTPDIIEEIEIIVAKEDISSSKKVTMQMSLIFGNDEKFYNQFEYQMLANIITWVAEEVFYSKKNK